ncbi:uncharacterized protein LOC143897763 [Temnothorax americanus]|uniref:uncharacterized protein LOC143897763 n=1 Tax=Temnothorax americanus TaxID=1964332 RepID=UPI004068152D
MRKSFRELSKRQKDRRILLLYNRTRNNFEPPVSINNDDSGGDILPGPSAVHDMDVSVPDASLMPLETDDESEVDSSDNNEYDNCESSEGSADCDVNISNDINIARSLSDDIRDWAIEFGITQKALTHLLHIHKRHGFDVPTDARTLLDTPKPHSYDVKNLSRGQYVHYGLGRALTTIINQTPQAFLGQTVIQLDINIDGLPIAKSSKSQLWPILGKISDLKQVSFLIGAYHGYSKAPLSEFLQPFVDECTVLQTDGFEVNGLMYRIKIRAIICDSPARAYVTCTKSHNAYFGCGKCTVRGRSINRRMTFTDITASLRTDADFKNRIQPQHHLPSISSSFELLSVPMIRSFVIDYMHNSCLGVMKQLLRLWMDKSQTSRVAQLHLNSLSTLLKDISKFVPIEFARNHFDLDEFSRWKATQYRTFLLYLGPAVLLNCLPSDKYLHFNVLNCAMRLLCADDSCDTYYDYANDLLRNFVQNMEHLYTAESVTYNLHNLIHLAADAKNFGPLDTFSAFPFENFLFKIKKLLRKFEKPLQQIYNRLSEQSNLVSNKIEHSSNNLEGPQLLQKSNKLLQMGCTNAHTRIKFPAFTLTTKEYNNYCYIKENNSIKIVCIQSIGYFHEDAVILGRKFMSMSSLRNYPCDSSNLHIFVVKNLSDNLEMWPVSSIQNKGFLIPLKIDCASYLILPLLHVNY